MYTPDEVHCGDVILVVPKIHQALWDKVLNEGIQISTVNPFAHAAMVVRHHNQLTIAEALFRITLSPVDKYAQNGWRFSTSLSTVQEEHLSRAAITKVGQLYGASMVWEDFLRDDIHLDIHPKLDPRHLDCSGYVWWAFQQAGEVLTYAPVPSPADLSYSPRLHGPRPW